MTALTLLEVCQNIERNYCKDCNLFVKIDDTIGYCDNSACDHYQHVITYNHTACDAVMTLDSVFNISLDIPVQV